METLPRALTELIEELGRLPGVGARTAERYAFAFLRLSPSYAKNLSKALDNLHRQIKICPKTYMLINADEEISPLYDNPKRDKQIVAVVEDPLDVVAMEKTNSFNGTYHVLGGVISPIDGIGPEQLHIGELIRRVKQDGVKEVIIATNASVEGESTAIYLNKQLSQLKGLKVTRLARGIPAGLDLEYADQITLRRAIEGRQSL